MNLCELGVGKVEKDGIGLVQFTDENISPEMAELLSLLSRAESWNEVRAVLSLYVDLDDGGRV